MELFLFSIDRELVRATVASAITGVVVDWERRGKSARQAGADTQINADTPDDLASVRAMTSARVLCRTNQWAAPTGDEIDMAAKLGADEVLLPMVRRPDEVDAALDAVDGRCGLGIMVETQAAVEHIDALVRRPLSRIYVGLNDLMIDRGSPSLFWAFVDGTVDRVAAATAAAGIPFGVAGLTRPEGGHPLPCRLLVGELARLGAAFTFLRRSFKADVEGRDPDVEVSRILSAVDAAGRRLPRQVAADREELEVTVRSLASPR